MTFDGNNFNDFPDIVLTREITTKNRKDFSRFLIRGAVRLFLEWA